MIKLYHNPRCTKSRESLALLEESGNDFEVKLYLQEGLSESELKDLQTKLNLPAIQWTRVKEADFSTRIRR